MISSRIALVVAVGEMSDATTLLSGESDTVRAVPDSSSTVGETPDAATLHGGESNTVEAACESSTSLSAASDADTLNGRASDAREVASDASNSVTVTLPISLGSDAVMSFVEKCCSVAFTPDSRRFIALGDFVSRASGDSTRLRQPSAMAGRSSEARPN